MGTIEMLGGMDDRSASKVPRTIYSKEYVRALFDRIAFRYDLLNHLLSSGFDFYWRAKAVRMLAPGRPQRILDVATGTGDLAIKAASLQPMQIIGIDISVEMLTRARMKVNEKKLGHLVTLQEGEAEHLSFPDASFDAVTAAFGVRNFSDCEQGLREMRRVLKPGGVAMILEFSQPGFYPLRMLFSFYSRTILPIIGGIISKSREAYEYLPATVDEFPSGEAMLTMLRTAGFTRTESHPLTLGIVSVYLARSS
jgi:demethylmenaquinone methyltransferase/2-methoxy-6-polyprenyl-1,4-benzoquinol methylase